MNNYSSNVGHQEQFRIWINNIIYGLNKKTTGAWTELQRQDHMLKIAKQVELPDRDIWDMENNYHILKESQDSKKG